jgi:hypothetical protein
MRHLTHELSEVLGKISHVVQTKLGEKAVDCSSFAISLPQSGKPLRIDFLESAGIKNFKDAAGYGGIYEDPPGV